MIKVARAGLMAIALLFVVGCRVLNGTTPISSSANATASASGVSLLQLFVLPDAGSKPVLDVLNGAQKSIRMEMYLLSDRDVIDALKSARGRGVDVRVLLEAQPTSGASGNQQTIKDLNAANISVKSNNPAFRLAHEKAIIVDDRVALIMTANLTRSAFTTNRGYGIIDSSPNDVAEISAVFEADWKRTTPNLSNSSLVWSPTNARQRVLSFIDGATKTLDIQAEEMQDKQMEDAIVNALKRGVVVRVIMSPAQDAKSDLNANGLGKIRDAGAQVRLVKTPYIHAKMMIADNTRAFIGSQNISTSSLDSNRELGIIVTDSKIIQTLSATLASDWNIGK